MTPTPRLTDDQLATLDLDAGLDELLRELRRHERTAARRWPVALVAAASVAGVAAVPTLVLAGGSPGRVVSPGPAASSAPAAPSATSATTLATEPSPRSDPTPQQPQWQGPSGYAVLEADGWRVTHVDTDPSYGISLTYTHGGQELSLDWTRERWYRGVLRDAETDGTAASTGTVEVLGEQARYYAYDSQQQMAYLPVHDGYGLRVDAAFTTEAEFADLLAALRAVDADGFAAKLPDDVLSPDETPAAATELLADASVPEGWEGPQVGGWNERASIAEQIVGDLGCLWAEAFVNARADADDAGRQAAVDALSAGPDWTLLAVIDDPRRYSITVGLMRDDAADQQVLGSACPMSLSLGAAPLPKALDGLPELPELPDQVIPMN